MTAFIGRRGFFTLLGGATTDMSASGAKAKWPGHRRGRRRVCVKSSDWPERDDSVWWPIISSMFMENLFSESAYFFEFLLGGSHVARGMFRDPRIVVGLMAVWTLLLIAWALFER
jgi:hypothetical protein